MDHLGFLIDMDGVIYRGDKAIPEAIAFVEKIQDYPYLFLTNNSAVTPQSIKEKLSGFGVPRCEIEHILTSAMATADYLQGQKPGFTYYAVGGPGLLAALDAYGRKDENDPDFVVIGEGEGLDYRNQPGCEPGRDPVGQTGHPPRRRCPDRPFSGRFMQGTSFYRQTESRHVPAGVETSEQRGGRGLHDRGQTGNRHKRGCESGHPHHSSYYRTLQAL